jgi:outer membrane protein assembly factor BamB
MQAIAVRETHRMPARRHVTMREVAAGLAAACILLGTLSAPSSADSECQPRNAPYLVRDGKGEYVLWRARIGYNAGPIAIADDKILVGTNNSSPRNPNVRGDYGVLMCFSRKDGSFLWQAAHARLDSRSEDIPGTVVTSKPFIEGDRAWYVSNRGELVCVDTAGFRGDQNDRPLRNGEHPGPTDAKIVWKLDMVKTLGVDKRVAPDVGNPTSSPIVYRDLVYCVTGHGRRLGAQGADARAPSFLAACKHTGRVVWTSNAPNESLIFSQWSSPALIQIDGDVQVVFPGGDGVLYGFAPASGRELWKIDLNEPRGIRQAAAADRRGFFVSTPVVHRNAVFVGLHQGEAPWTHEGFPLYAVEIERAGASYKAGIRWMVAPPQFSGTLGEVAVADDLVFAVSDNGIVFALDAASGEQVWHCDLLEQPGLYGSPYLDHDLLVVASADRVFAMAADREEKVLGQYDLGAVIRGTPVIRDGAIYVTAGSYLWALRAPGAESGEQ